MPTKRKLRAGVITLTVFLALLEAALRLGFGFGRPLLYAPDDVVGYITAPNQDLRRFGARIHINEFGMRSSSIRASKPSSVTRLLFIGDSVAFGTTYVDQAQIFTARIQGALDGKYGNKIEVLNASAGGWAPENEYAYLSSRGTFQANFIIFVLNTNDLAQPFQQLDISPQFPIRNPFSAIGEVLERYAAPVINSGIRTSDPGSIATSEPDPGVEQRVLRTLARARALAKINDASFVLIFSPTDQEKLKTPAWKSAISALEGWASDSGVVLMDMSASYARYPQKRVYFDGIHLRPFGHEVVAAEFLSRFDRLYKPDDAALHAQAETQ